MATKDIAWLHQLDDGLVRRGAGTLAIRRRAVRTLLQNTRRDMTPGVAKARRINLPYARDQTSIDAIVNATSIEIDATRQEYWKGSPAATTHLHHVSFGR
jgi:hypothetical protein